MRASKNYFQYVVCTGLIAGTLDGLAASILYYIQSSGKDPLNVWRFVASGVFGSDAFSGGVPIALLGILFHYLIALGWVVIFFLLYRNVKLLSKNWFFAGVAYGIFVWSMMNFIVVPLSLVPVHAQKEWPEILIAVIILIICIGLPVSFRATKYFKVP